MSAHTETPGHGHKHTNRLAGSSSPYLLQHAHNPVDWYPWGPEAFAEARRRDVPIFLSIGYSTCYWCHVMERESFESESTAAVMNQRYVNIKLDREQRPDLDEIYMAAVQMLTGSGGWPMSVFLEPTTLKPFWGGTYFPPVPAFGRPSFVQVLERISAAYSTQRSDVTQQADQVSAAIIDKLGAPRPPVIVDAQQVTRAAEQLLTTFDRIHGGFGGSPKFPQPAYLEFLLEALPVLDDATAGTVRETLHATLEAMSIGGIFDHIGGGFHRYAVDASWTVPHFEKMLYDNAQLLGLYAQAAAPEPEHSLRRFGYERTCQATAGFALEQMSLSRPSGRLFFTALDAEVGGREGLSYLWTDDSLRAAITAAGHPADLAAFAASIFGTDKGTNFQDPHHPSDPPASVLRLAEPLRTLLPALGLEAGEFARRLDRITAALRTVRDARQQPRLDDKVLPSLNGMMLTALARAAQSLGHTQWLAAADSNARAIMAELSSPSTAGGPQLCRSFRNGTTEGEGLLEDYAHVIAGLLALGRALGEASDESVTTFTPDRLARMHELTAQAEALFTLADARFGDPAGGGFFDAQAGQADLFVRPRQTYDGAVPSAQSVMLHNSIDLFELTAKPQHLDRAIRCLAGVSAEMADSPVATINATRGLLRLLKIMGNSVLTDRLVAAGARRGGSTEEPVQIAVSTDTIELVAGEPTEMFVKLEIQPGYHINSAFAAEQSGGVVIPLRFDLTGVTEQNVALYADYEQGEPLEYDQGGGRITAGHTVHHGDLVVKLVLEMIDGKSVNLTGNERITVQYQACRDDACMQPSRKILPVELRVVG